MPTRPPDRGTAAIGVRIPAGFASGWSAAARCGTALAITLVVIWLCVTLDPPGNRLPFITFFPAVMIAGWLGGLWPGILSTIICAISIQAFGLHPTPTWDRLGLLLFVALGVFISGLNEERRRGTFAALAEGHRLRQTLACVADAVITADEHGVVTALNDVAESLTGWTAVDVVGRSLDTAFLAIDERSQQPDPLFSSGAFAAHTVALKIEGKLLATRTGDYVPIEGYIAPIRPERGPILGWVVIFRDVSERRRAEQQQADLLDGERQLVMREQEARAESERARAESERASRLKDEFLAVLSHELRTPMNAVLGYARLLSVGALAPDRVPLALTAIHRNAQAQARLIESLLDSSRVMTGKLALDLGPVDLVSVVEAAVDAIRPDAASKGIFLHMQTPPDPIVLTGDSGRLQQVFWNLLANAVKFTAGGGRIDLRVARQPERAVVTVADTGVGIAPDFLPYVFDRFRQADRRSMAAGGLGLGLALVREIVQAHGGTVSAASPGLGHGSIFTAILPLSITQRAATSTSSAETATSPLEVLPLLTILVVDDESDARDLLAMTLESRGANVEAVGSVREALDALDAQHTDLLVSDLRMPEEDGFSLIRRVREREGRRQSRRLPAIAVSAQASGDERGAALAAGFDQHIAKPVDLGALIRAILTLTTRNTRS